MSIDSENAKVIYVANGENNFVIDFLFKEAADLAVFTRENGIESEKTLYTDYQVINNKVVFVETPNVGVKIAILRKTRVNQTTTFENGGKLPVEALNGVLDKIIMILQEHKEKLSRAMALPITDENIDNPMLVITNTIAECRLIKNEIDGLVRKINTVIVHATPADYSIYPDGTFLLDTSCDRFGLSQLITVGENGNWFVDGVDTNYSASSDLSEYLTRTEAEIQLGAKANMVTLENELDDYSMYADSTIVVINN